MKYKTINKTIDGKLKNALCIIGWSQAWNIHTYETRIVTNIIGFRGMKAQFIIWLREPTEEERFEGELCIRAYIT